MTELQNIGAPGHRSDADEKITGGATYTTDITLPGMLHARVLRSPHAHARLVSINADAARARARCSRGADPG